MEESRSMGCQDVEDAVVCSDYCQEKDSFEDGGKPLDQEWTRFMNAKGAKYIECVCENRWRFDPNLGAGRL